MIDRARVTELQNEIGEDGFAEVVLLFLEEADEAIAKLLSGVGTSDIESQLHFIKGSALNLGLTELAALCQAGERLASTGAPQGVNLHQIGKAYQTSRAAYLEGLNSKSVA